MQLSVAESLTKAILSNEAPKLWTEATIKKYIKAPKEVSLEIGGEIDSISLSYDVSEWQAAILRHARIP
jgi:hypothetical protein